MTAEEKAEAYVIKKHNIDTEHQSIDFCLGIEFSEDIADFLAGYEQGYEDCRHYAHDYYKRKWHDLRKNPDDLPKEIEICSTPVYIVSKHGSSDLAQYDYKQKLWCYSYSNDHILYEVIAWCELPRFEE